MAQWWPDGLPNSERIRAGRIHRDLKAMGATVEAMERRRIAYRKQMPQMPWTPEACVKHWGILGEDRKGDNPLL